MKRNICLMAMACWMSYAFGQTKIERTIEVSNGQKVMMDFTWPELVTINTWDKNEIKVSATVSINNGQNDDAFELKLEERQGVVELITSIKDKDKLPRKIVIRKGGESFFFDTDNPNSPEVLKFKKEHGTEGYDYMNFGVIKDIYVTVYVPRNVVLDVSSKYGMVEVLGFTGEMSVHSKFGGVDISVPNAKNTIKAGTKFGEKFTNLTHPFSTIALGTHPGKWDWVACKVNGGGKVQELKSEFGNIYIRKL